MKYSSPVAKIKSKQSTPNFNALTPEMKTSMVFAEGEFKKKQLCVSESIAFSSMKTLLRQGLE